MAFNPGRNVGKLSIRVVPDTTKFRNDLKQKLQTIERTTRMAVRVDKANLDRNKIREDLRQQMAGLKNVQVDADVRVTIDKARLKKTALRKSIQEQFDKFDNIRVSIEAVIKNVEHFEKEVRDMVQRASRNKVKIDVAALTAAATTQMRWLTRDRFVTIFVKVSKTSVVSALTTLAALSGARLSWKWIDSLIDKFKELDKNLPAILGWTTGITSLIASLFAATSGLVGIGEGLFSISPALLVLPGLLINALGSLTALIVALRNTSTELSPLKDDMRELGDIINGEFWGRARQPILDLVNGLMPQLRTSFADLSAGIGDFTGAMSRAFGKELANGRLASIFNGIAEGWRVLGTGADGFAGALVSLSNIAAQYTPRLAAWFVRQANTFDKWLKAISEDGRLGKWMEDAIDSMYDLWDATRGIAGVFAGIWKASEKAGSGGLHGFAQLMLTWRRVVNSADFQQGLEAVFRGSYVAMEAFGGAIKGIGRLIRDNSAAFEKFIGTAGIFLGGLVEGIADALNTPTFAAGLNDLSGGLLGALDGVLPHLPAIADTFGNFLGLLGDLTGSLIPTAAGVLAELMPGIDGLISAIRPALPGLSQAATDIAKTLGPAISDLLKALGPAAIDAIRLLADGIVAVSPLLGPLIEGLAALVRSIADLLGWMTDGIADLATNKPDGTDVAIVEAAKAKGIKLELDLDAIADINVMLRDLNVPGDVAGRIQQGLINPQTLGASGKAARELAAAFRTQYETTLKEKGQFAADALVEGIVASDLPESVKNAIGAQLNAAGHEYEYFKDVGKTSAGLFSEGLNDGKISISESMKMWKDTFIREFEKSGVDGAQALWDGFNGYDQDSADMQGLLESLRKMGIDIKDEMGDAGAGISSEVLKGLQSDDFHLGMRKSGEDAASSFKDGLSGGTGGASGGGFSFSRGIAQSLEQGKPEVKSAAERVFDAIRNVFTGGDTGEVEATGRRVPASVAAGIDANRGATTLAAVALIAGMKAIFSSAGNVSSQAGQSVAAGFAQGIAGGTPLVGLAAFGVVLRLRAQFATSRQWLLAPGAQTMVGYASGLSIGGVGAIAAAARVRASVVRAASGGSLFSVGFNMMAGMAAGIRSGAVVAAISARAAVQTAISAAKRAAEIHSPSRLTAREIGKPLIQGVAVGIDKNADGVRRSMVNAVDVSDVSGKSPALAGVARSNVALHVHNPVVRDLMQDTWDAAQMAGVLA